MIIWQLLMLGMLVMGVLGAYGKHTDGDREEAAKFATGTAALVGILAMITGFAGVAGRKDAEQAPAASRQPAPQPRSVPAPQPIIQAPRPAPMVQAPMPVQASAPVAPVQQTQPVINLGTPGAAFERVEAIMMRYKQLYQQGVNEIQKTDLRFARGQELCRNQAPQYAALARVGAITTNKVGDASVNFTTLSGMELIPSQTFARGTPIHDLLANVAPSTTVAVTFTFESDNTDKDCFHSHRWTEDHNMTMPQWDVNLVYVQLLQ